ncbi:hypothetical protein L873DRAFT_1832012 [Choiromyces venosus 120613-1]|uniref:Pal1-domain-containing protein n=1 Tax=Choiromyces venosus 120613-1 TaxID=1336337 RepID=A0A3N4IX10_9PEZI|nr:hypothetical protein L873DRAFT_1832012 [Choiromyces venosus 120613-1]
MTSVTTMSQQNPWSDSHIAQQPRLSPEDLHRRRPNSGYRAPASFKQPRSEHRMASPHIHRENKDRPSPRPNSHARSRSHNTGIPKTDKSELMDPSPPYSSQKSRRRPSFIPGPDTIDRLDNGVFGGHYHHEGPYDSTLLARQNGPRPPVEALRESNAAALAATPMANILDSLEKHKPLQGTAMVAPGTKLPNGEFIGDYEEYDMMRQGPGGSYRRYSGFNYPKEDLKGKGEPGFTQDLLDKQRKAERKMRKPEAQGVYQMVPQTNSGKPVRITRGRSSSVSYQTTSNNPAFQSDSGSLGRSKSSASRDSPSKASLGSRLKKKFNWVPKKD